MSETDMEAFSAMSGDVNPLHRDAKFARDKGFSGQVVYGALLAAQLSRLIGMEVPGRDGIFTGFTISFRGPVSVGELIDFHAIVTQKSDATRAVVMKYDMRSGKRLIANGTAEAIMSNAR